MENNQIKRQLSRFRAEMKASGDKDRAVYEKAYLKSPNRFFGTSLPVADRMAKEFRKRNPDAGREYIMELAAALFASEYHDEKRLGLRLLQFHPEFLDLSVMPMLEEMLQKCCTWDLIDDISIHLVGEVLAKDRKAYAHLKRWGRSDNFWIRRASLISPILLFRRGAGDTALFYSLAETMLSEKEFFIRKAIGWGLREISKADPDAVYLFLMKNRDMASGLTLREGAKRLPEEMRAEILKT